MVVLNDLTDKNFIKEFKFENLYYLEILFLKLKNFLMHIPVPYILDFNKEHSVLIMRVGSYKKNFKLDADIFYSDFIKQIKNWIINYYPQYYLDDMYGIILKIFFKQDKFLFYNNGVKELRYSGNKNIPMSIDTFLKKIRKIEDKKELKDFILFHSTIIEVLNSSEKEIEIDYLDKMMFNFFKINIDDLKCRDIQQIGELKYKIGKYVIQFNNDIIKIQCMNYLKNF